MRVGHMQLFEISQSVESQSGQSQSPATLMTYDLLMVGIGKTYLYSAFHETSPQGAQIWITQVAPANYTIPASTLQTFARWRHLIMGWLRCTKINQTTCQIAKTCIHHSSV